MDDRQLLRHARHILLDDIGIEGQQRIAGAHALLIGAGGLGCPAALYLGACGIGRLTLVDDDVVELGNLHRQIAHTEARLGQNKAESLRCAVQAINPGVDVRCHTRRADAALLDRLVPQATLVLDGSDNYRTRHAVNAACVRHGVPLISASALGFDGQLFLMDPNAAHSPCYACLFAPDENFQEVSCARMGVFSALVGVMGSMQAAEALRWIAGVGERQPGRLLRFDARRSAWSRMQAVRAPDCPVCGGSAQAPSSSRSSPASSSTGTPSACARVSLLPASSPATT